MYRLALTSKCSSPQVVSLLPGLTQFSFQAADEILCTDAGQAAAAAGIQDLPGLSEPGAFEYYLSQTQTQLPGTRQLCLSVQLQHSWLCIGVCACSLHVTSKAFVWTSALDHTQLTVRRRKRIDPAAYQRQMPETCSMAMTLMCWDRRLSVWLVQTPACSSSTAAGCGCPAASRLRSGSCLGSVREPERYGDQLADRAITLLSYPERRKFCTLPIGPQALHQETRGTTSQWTTSRAHLRKCNTPRNLRM